jgi:predicted nucleic acid-binding protein
VIFIDSNIPMYLVGAPHPNKDATRRLLESCIERAERLVTSAEVYQEVLHRYRAIKRPDAIGPAFAALDGVVDEVFAVELADVERARDLLLGHPDLSSRDALHASIMRRHGVSRILTFDAGFDAIPGVERVS